MKVLMKKEITMASFEIAEQTGKLHSHVMRDIRKMLDELGKDQSIFGAIYKDSYGRGQDCFVLPKKEILCLVSGYSIKLRMAIIDRLEELENKKHDMPESKLEWMELAVETEKQKQLVMQENKTLAAKALTDKPKVEFADAVTATESSILVGDLAKLICQNGVDIGQNRLYEWMRLNKYIMRRQGSMTTPTQGGMNLGLFEIHEQVYTKENGSSFLAKTTMVTAKGIAYFIPKLLSEKHKRTQVKINEQSTLFKLT